MHTCMHRPHLPLIHLIRPTVLQEDPGGPWAEGLLAFQIQEMQEIETAQLMTAFRAHITSLLLGVLWKIQSLLWMDARMNALQLSSGSLIVSAPPNVTASRQSSANSKQDFESGYLPLDR
eukprot:gb/GECG01012492.1/.p1 GENE.gb/GECG01012492.1/~~gb/GECG01012492.1/.p1  ORF type:complete len:120 (+),score=8.20 gb/GECG01012492.1/:1-360(+)